MNSADHQKHVWDQNQASLLTWGLKDALAFGTGDSIINATATLRKAANLTDEDLADIWAGVGV